MAHPRSFGARGQAWAEPGLATGENDLASSTSRFCHLCGQPWQGGEFYVHPEHPHTRLAVCQRCLREAERCRRCGLPMVAGLSSGGVCALCATGAPRCRSCGMPITGGSIQINGQGPYCPACFAGRQRCDVCASPLDDQAQRLPDGRAICSVCQRTAVVAAGEAKALFDHTLQIIDEAVGIRLQTGVRFVVTDRPGLRAQVERARRDMIEQADQVLGIYVRDRAQRTIYVQNGLPRILLAQVIAHEWAHAWQVENCPRLRDVYLIEGLAEWVAYKVLQAMGASKKMALMTARTDVYGEALRRMLAWETREGVQGVLGLCTTERPS